MILRILVPIKQNFPKKTSAAAQEVPGRSQAIFTSPGAVSGSRRVGSAR